MITKEKKMLIDNKITNGGANALGEVLKTNSTLTGLHLGSDKE